jgi:hypothetical protein
MSSPFSYCIFCFNAPFLLSGFETTFAHTYNTVPAGLVEATITLTRSTLVKSYSIVSTMAVCKPHVINTELQRS